MKIIYMDCVASNIVKKKVHYTCVQNRLETTAQIGAMKRTNWALIVMELDNVQRKSLSMDIEKVQNFNPRADNGKNIEVLQLFGTPTSTHLTLSP
jgi:hypothetical protein